MIPKVNYVGKSYRYLLRRCFLVTYSTCNGHLSRTSPCGLPRHLARSMGPRRSGPHDRASPHVARSRGGAREERDRRSGSAVRKTKRGPRKRETTAETWKASSSGCLPSVSPSLPRVPHHHHSPTPFLIASSGKEEVVAIPLMREDATSPNDACATLDLSTRLKISHLCLLLSTSYVPS